MKNKSYYVFGMIVSIFIAVNIAIYMKDDNTNIAQIYIYMCSFIPNSKENLFFELILSCIPTMVVVFLFGNEVSNKLKKNAQYIFTRTRKRGRWLIKEYIKLFSNVFIYSIGVLLIVFGIYRFIGYEVGIEKYNCISICIAVFLLIINDYLLVILCNLFNLYEDDMYSYICTVLIYIVNIISVSFLNITQIRFVIKYLPFIQNVIAIENYIKISEANLQSITYLNLGTYKFSILYILIILIYMILISVKRIKKVEFY